MEKVMRKVSFGEAEQLDSRFRSSKSPAEKWRLLTQLRQEYNGRDARLQKVMALDEFGFGSIKVTKKNLISNKLASRRKQNLADVEKLERIHRTKEGKR